MALSLSLSLQNWRRETQRGILRNRHGPRALRHLFASATGDAHHLKPHAEFLGAKMRTGLATLLLVFAGVTPAAESFAAASATVSLSNGRSITIDQTGFASQPAGPPVFNVDLIPISLGNGQSTDFSFDYAISVKDDGLPVQPLAPPPPGSILLPPFRTDSFSGPASGVDHEQAAAIFSVDVFVARGQSPVLRWSTDGPLRLSLKTNADSFADSLSQSGTTHVHVVNPMPLPLPGNPAPSSSVVFEVQLAAWVLASPIPEPATFLQMAAGVGLLPLLRLASRRH